MTTFVRRVNKNEMQDYTEISFGEYIELLQPDYVFNNEVAVMEIDGSRGTFVRPELYPIKVKVFSIMLTVGGEANLHIDYLSIPITGTALSLILRIHVFNGFSYSADFKGYYVVISPEFVEKYMMSFVPPHEVLDHKRSFPVSAITEPQSVIMLNAINKLTADMERSNHMYQPEIIQHDVVTLFMEMLDIEVQNMKVAPVRHEIDYNESIVRDFIRLTIENSRTEHNVLFYATELCLTTTQLSRILKALTGKTALNWINETQIIESKLLLRKRELSVQMVAEMMNFSDQSAFGKFFKKHTGLSPLEYKHSLSS